VSKLLVAMPLYTHVSTNFLIGFLRLDKQHMVEIIPTRKQYLAASMAEMCSAALNFDTAWDRLIVYEADMIPPIDAMVRIAEYPDECDVVGSMYFDHHHPYHPKVFQQATDDPVQYKPLWYNQIEDMMDNPGLYPVDAVGFGFTSIHHRVLESVPMLKTSEFGLGHDMDFCYRVKQAGFNVHVDSAIQSWHLTEVAIKYEDYLKAKPQERN
jgi:hypothetical protein